MISVPQFAETCFSLFPFPRSFFAVSVVLVYLYHAVYHQVDQEEFGGIWELVKEGMMTSFALFLVWGIIYAWGMLLLSGPYNMTC
jgi:hypothetical protein